VSRIFFDNIKCDSENGAFIGGEEGKVSNIKIENSSFKIEKKQTSKAAFTICVHGTTGLLKDGISAFYFDTAKDIVVSNCSVEWGKENPGYFNKVLFAKNIQNLSVTKISGEAARPNSEKCVFLNCQNITVE
jgi:hypothetical protein